MNQLKVIISGYENYEGVDVNPSKEVPSSIANHASELCHFLEERDDSFKGLDLKIKAVSLPISFEKAWPMLHEAIEEFQPNIVISTGLKRKVRSIAMERCAVNIKNTAQKSESEERLSSSDNEPIDVQGPAAYWTRLPLRSILQEFAKHNIAATLSSDAGTYVCNAVFYSLLHWTRKHPDVLAGFVSLPPVVDSVSLENRSLGLPLEQQIQAGKDVVQEAVRYYMQPSSSDMLIA
jgi:pyroglutamyl-peptidase